MTQTDTGPFIHLDEIQHLELLQAVFNTIVVPEQVMRELSNQSARFFIEQNPKFIQVEPVPDEALFAGGTQGDVLKNFTNQPFRSS